jgi:8-amino-7-oxononanoate synthase
MKPFLEDIELRLAALRSDGLLRSLAEPQGIDFASNDYLGLSAHPAIRERVAESARAGAVGAPASRLLRGNTAAHRALERRLASFKGSPDALFFPSGYQANLALLSTIAKPDDLALSDEWNHASIVDGLRLAGVRVVAFAHADATALEAALRARGGARRVFIVTESLFSMDGDRAPLDRYAALAESHAAELIVDDAHATGIFGASRGSGLIEEFGIEDRVLASVSTCGKALGVSGAFVASARVLIDYLVNRARPFIFSTAVPPIVLAAVDAALEITSSEPWRRERVLALAERLRTSLREASLDCRGGPGPIVPVVLGRSDRALRVAEAVRARGFDVRAVRPPAVPPRTARLRLSVHSDHDEATIDALARAVIDAVHDTSDGGPR